MQFSERMAHIKPSATLTINAKALELKSQGVDVTSLAIGEPNFPTPAHVCDAAKQAIDEGFTRYTAVPGIPPLREAIAGYFKRAYGVDVAPDCTIASNGGKQSLYNLFAALLNDGDEVLIPSPYWVSYPDMVYLNGGVPVAVKAPASQGFKVTVEQLEAALTPKTKILVFNSPSNPTGACYSVSERDAIVKWALDRGLFIIADEIYDQLVYEPNKPSSIIVWWKQYPDRIAVVNGLAKSFAMTGWRVGYTVTHPDLVKKLQPNHRTGHRQHLFRVPEGRRSRPYRPLRLCGVHAPGLPEAPRYGMEGNRLMVKRGVPETRGGVLPVRGYFRPV